MASITFDEFHAIQSRQRAAAEASKRKDNPVGDTTSSAKPPNHTDERGRRSLATERRRAESFARSSRGGSDAGDDVAPTSGSATTHTKHRTQFHQQTTIASGDANEHTRNVPNDPSPSQQRRRPGLKTSSGARSQGLSASSLGRFAELLEVQMAVVIVIYLDLVASTAQLLPYMQPIASNGDGSTTAGTGGWEGEGGGGSTSASGRLVLRLLQSFTGFTMVFFVIEVAMLLAAFRGKFFRHLGYVLDLAVISACVYHDLAGMAKGVRLLGALRVWRVARVMNTLLLAADEARDDTKDALNLAEKRTQELDTDRRRLQETLRREIEARKRVDNMLRGYKDEVETLNEALKIAAMDIAEAGVSGGLAHGEGNDNNRGDKSPGENLEAEKEEGATKRAQLGDVALSDTDDNSRTLVGTGGKKVPGAGRGLTAAGRGDSSSSGRIFVFQDGTFQAR